jgi:hypothetical protein
MQQKLVIQPNTRNRPQYTRVVFGLPLTGLGIDCEPVALHGRLKHDMTVRPASPLALDRLHIRSAKEACCANMVQKRPCTTLKL